MLLPLAIDGRRRTAMRTMTLMLIWFLLGATPTEVPMGKFQTWLAYKKVPLDFAAGGVTVHVEALPCPARPIGDSTCRWEGFNNQGTVTVSAPGMPPLKLRAGGADRNSTGRCRGAGAKSLSAIVASVSAEQTVRSDHGQYSPVI